MDNLSLSRNCPENHKEMELVACDERQQGSAEQYAEYAAYLDEINARYPWAPMPATDTDCGELPF